MKYEFPEGFLWGAATSAHQIEGGLENDWSEWERSGARIENLKQQGKAPANYISGEATKAYVMNNANIKCLTDLGASAYRFSVDWSRIEPNEGDFQESVLEHYLNFAKKLRGHDIEPFVTLWHWPVPLWVRDMGGWKSRDMLPYFERYCERVVDVLGEVVDFWVPLNEPFVYADNSYRQGEWPPQEKSARAMLQVVNNLIRGHKLAANAIKRLDDDYQIGVASHNIHFDPVGNSPVNKLLAWGANVFWNDYFLHRVKSSLDFIGLNYYFHAAVDYGGGENENRVVSDLGWELYPEGLYHVIDGLKKYDLPIYITEHGLADKDDNHRSWYLKESLCHIHRAIQDGADVRGYLHWSLTDNFEWAEGFIPRFGLYEVDYDTYERIPRPSVEVYRTIIKNNGLMS